MFTKNYRQLAFAILLQAVTDYCKTTSESTKFKILQDLRTEYMDSLTDGMSIVVADQLEQNPKEIAARLRQHHEIGGDQK